MGPRALARLLALLRREVPLKFQLFGVAPLEVQRLVKASTSAGREEHVAPSRSQFRGRIALVVQASHNVLAVGLADAAETPGGAPRAGRLVAARAAPPPRQLAPRPVPRRRSAWGRRRRRARELFLARASRRPRAAYLSLLNPALLTRSGSPATTA